MESRRRGEEQGGVAGTDGGARAAADGLGAVVGVGRWHVADPDGSNTVTEVAVGRWMLLLGPRHDEYLLIVEIVRILTLVQTLRREEGCYYC